MIETASEVLALKAALDDTKRSLIAHDFLVRALLTHLAVSDPKAFNGVIDGLAKAGLYGEGGDGELTREVAWELTCILEEVASGLPGKA